jgi:hypothetical protein
MACEIQAGRLEPCKTVGGLKNVYFGAFDSSQTFTLGANGEITAFGNALTVYRWELRGANTMDEANESSRDNGTSFYTATGTFQFKKQDAEARAELEKLSNGVHYVITEGYDGSVKIYGLDDGAEVSVNSASGAGMGDFNGYNVTVTSLGTIPARFASLSATNLTVSSTFLTI